MVKELSRIESSDRSNNVCQSSSSSSNNNKYKGVRKRKWGKYVSEIRLPNSRERIWLGSYDTAEKAARAFDAAQFCLRGRTARFNFPDNPPEIAGGGGGRSMTSAEIQLAASRFAHSEPVASGTGRVDNVDISMSCSISSKSEPSDLRAESPCPSVSCGAFQVDNSVGTDIPLDTALFDSISMGPESNFMDFGIYPGFDDFFVPSIAGEDYGEEYCDGFSTSQDSFLWNF